MADRFIVASGEHGALPHGIAGERRVRRGDMITPIHLFLLFPFRNYYNSINRFSAFVKFTQPFSVISILIFHRERTTGVIRRMAVGMHSPVMSGIYENVQAENETVWEAAGRVVAELAPEKIAVK